MGSAVHIAIVSFLVAAHALAAVPATPAILPFRLKSTDMLPFKCRNVPGDGSCLFYALASCITYSRCGYHLPFDSELRKFAQTLRRIAVETLLNSDEPLYLEYGDATSGKDLLHQVALHYNTTVDAYCSDMLKPHKWGGGPEIVALSNYFKRPVHVFELVPRGFIRKRFEIQHRAKFGSPQFDNKSPLCILCADGRFPNVRPGKQIEEGDHFLSLFPETHQHPYQKVLSVGGSLLKRPRRAEGGDRDLLHDDAGRRPVGPGSSAVEPKSVWEKVSGLFSFGYKFADNDYIVEDTAEILRSCPGLYDPRR
jgi:hypothetical protein